MNEKPIALLVFVGGAIALALTSARSKRTTPPKPQPPTPGPLLMYPSVRAELIPFLAHDEGEGDLPWLYLDAKGYPTIGVGNKLAGLADALRLTWTHLDGSPATPFEVTTAWNAVNARTDLAGKGGGKFEKVTNVRATDASINALINRDLVSFEPLLVRDFPRYPTATADAQLGLLRMSWAMGPAFAHDPNKWPKFRAAFNAGEWSIAGDESRMSEVGQPPEFAHGNDLTQLLFRNAAYVAANGLPLSTLYYPLDLSKGTA